jgi:hypothetical protein
MLGVQVLNEHKRHAGVLRQMPQKLEEGFQTAGRSSDPDNGEAIDVRPLVLGCLCGVRMLQRGCGMMNLIGGHRESFFAQLGCIAPAGTAWTDVFAWTNTAPRC